MGNRHRSRRPRLIVRAVVCGVLGLVTSLIVAWVIALRYDHYAHVMSGHRLRDGEGWPSVLAEPWPAPESASVNDEAWSGARWDGWFRFDPVGPQPSPPAPVPGTRAPPSGYASAHTPPPGSEPQGVFYWVEREQFGLPLKMVMRLSATEEDSRAGTEREGRLRTFSNPSGIDVSGPWPRSWGIVAPRLPIEPIWSGLIVNSLVVGAPIWLLWCGPSFFAVLRGLRRERADRCISCGYPLADLAACPECGTSRRAGKSDAVSAAGSSSPGSTTLPP